MPRGRPRSSSDYDDSHSNYDDGSGSGYYDDESGYDDVDDSRARLMSGESGRSSGSGSGSQYSGSGSGSRSGSGSSASGEQDKKEGNGKQNAIKLVIGLVIIGILSFAAYKYYGPGSKQADTDANGKKAAKKKTSSKEKKDQSSSSSSMPEQNIVLEATPGPLGGASDDQSDTGTPGAAPEARSGNLAGAGDLAMGSEGADGGGGGGDMNAADQQGQAIPAAAEGGPGAPGGSEQQGQQEGSKQDGASGSKGPGDSKKSGIGSRLGSKFKKNCCYCNILKCKPGKIGLGFTIVCTAALAIFSLLVATGRPELIPFTPRPASNATTNLSNSNIFEVRSSIYVQVIGWGIAAISLIVCLYSVVAFYYELRLGQGGSGVKNGIKSKTITTDVSGTANASITNADSNLTPESETTTSTEAAGVPKSDSADGSSPPDSSDPNSQLSDKTSNSNDINITKKPNSKQSPPSPPHPKLYITVRFITAIILFILGLLCLCGLPVTILPTSGWNVTGNMDKMTHRNYLQQASPLVSNQNLSKNDGTATAGNDKVMGIATIAVGVCFIGGAIVFFCYGCLGLKYHYQQQQGNSKSKGKSLSVAEGKNDSNLSGPGSSDLSGESNNPNSNDGPGKGSSGASSWMSMFKSKKGKKDSKKSDPSSSDDPYSLDSKKSNKKKGFFSKKLSPGSWFGKEKDGKKGAAGGGGVPGYGSYPGAQSESGDGADGAGVGDLSGLRHGNYGGGGGGGGYGVV